jgi:hypothetical protein
VRRTGGPSAGSYPARNPKRRLEEGKAPLRREDPVGGRRENADGAGIFSCRNFVPSGRFRPVVRAETSGVLKLPEEQELVDLVDVPVAASDLEAAEEGRQAGRLVRCQSPKEECSVGRLGRRSPGPVVRSARRPRIDGSRHARGARRDHRP